MRTWYLLLGLLVAVMMALAGCGGGSSDGARVQMLVGDAPIQLSDGTTVTAVNVNIQTVELLREADNEATRVTLFDADEPASFDLLALANTSLTTLPKLGAKTIPAGHYTQMRIILAGDNTVSVEGDAQPRALTVASGQQTGFKVNVNLDFAEGAFETILLDFNLAKLQQQGNTFHLTPNALRVVKISQTGNITGAVTQTEPITLTSDLLIKLTLVDAQQQPVTDAEGNAIATQLSWAAGETISETNGTFTLNGVPSGEYFVQVEATYGTQTLAIDPIPVTVTSGENANVTLPLPILP